jgi:TPR repeat protein
VPQDVDRAVDWYRRAATNGYAGSKILRPPADAP